MLRLVCASSTRYGGHTRVHLSSIPQLVCERQCSTEGACVLKRMPLAQCVIVLILPWVRQEGYCYCTVSR